MMAVISELLKSVVGACAAVKPARRRVKKMANRDNILSIQAEAGDELRIKTQYLRSNVCTSTYAKCNWRIEVARE